MSLSLTFRHATNGNATATMSIDDAAPTAFDYVTLVKWLFDNQDTAIEVSVAESYTGDQKKRIEELLQKIKEAAMSGNAEPAPTTNDLEDIPF